MKTIHRDPLVEEGISNVVLQNRCGNRVTLMAHASHTELEFVYKPNAYRRRDYRARNFSCRDNQTELFGACRLPEIGVEAIEAFDYDPFLTRLRVRTPTGARNVITVLNVADENVFGLAAEQPLTLLFHPRVRFECRDGLLTESFHDRGEDIVAFIAFDGYERDRFRPLEDGGAVLQIFENEVVWVGGEETAGQVDRVLRKLRPLSLAQAAEATERRIAPALAKGRLRIGEPDFQRVADFNRRVVHSGMDEGGACFGALNRIYYLIWNRDGAMTSAMLARCGAPDLVERFAPFILANPAERRAPDGRSVPEYLQILGSRWTKSEDDGIYYAALALHTLVETTGRTDLLDTPEFDRYLEALAHNIATRFDGELGLFGSDTRGESTLKSGPDWGYDTVNGTLYRTPDPVLVEGRPVWRAYTLYHNVNLYNVLRMTAALLALRGGGEAWAQRCRELAGRLRRTLNREFVQPDGTYYAGFYRFEDGSTHWQPYEENPWEYTWACTIGPFNPNLAASIRTARVIRERWARESGRGYCPWNTLAGFLHDYGLDSRGYRDMLRQEIDEAITQSVKYPMAPGLTEYANRKDSWRPLPFSAGSYLWATAGLLLKPLPAGLAVRANALVTGVENYRYRDGRIDVTVEGSGDAVLGWTLNGGPVEGTLQVPEDRLRFGPNRVIVRAGAASAGGVRLFAGSAALLGVEAGPGTLTYRFGRGDDTDLVFENLEAATDVVAEDGEGNPLAFTREALPAEGMTELRVASRGDFILRVAAPAPIRRP